MHRLIINKLGPIERCELDCVPFLTLTGFQASGKSTIAKVIYYFRTIKEDIEELAKKQAFNAVPINGMEDEYDVGHGLELKKRLEGCLREKFLSTFGSSWGMPDDMYIEYYYTEACFVKISLKRDMEHQTPNNIWITFSCELKEFLRENNDCFSMTPLGVPEDEIRLFRKRLYEMFDDSCSVVYIPAGRSMITLLSNQLNYIYANMDDIQKRSLDRCTKDYLERILRIKPEFSDGLRGLAAYSRGKTGASSTIVRQALELVERILRGTYCYSNGEERINLDDGRYVKINFSSSGQQECVWILNLLFYYLLQQKQILFVVEEPESHLFPASQKYITDLIALVSNSGHSVVLTTHSPYVLGELNNLLYAHGISAECLKKAEKIIPQSLWLDYQSFDARFVKNGMAENCMDAEIHMICNERIDEISKVINDDFDMLLELQCVNEKGAV